MRAIAGIAWAACAAVAVAADGAPPATAPAEDANAPLPPAVTLAGGQLRIDVLLPTPRAILPHRYEEPWSHLRFDWSGRVAFAEYKGHTFIGRRRRGPDGHAAPAYSLGTSEEFRGAPMLSAKGDNPARFLRIGAGVMSRRFEGGKRVSQTIEPFVWQHEPGPAWVDFRQEVSLPGGWGYRYHKRVALDANVPCFSIRHHFVNTGGRELRLEHYCHNWLTIDSRPVEADGRVLLGFEPRGRVDPNVGGILLTEQQAFAAGRLVRFVPDKLAFKAFFPFEGSFEPQANRVTVANAAAGAGVTVFGDWTAHRVAIYREGETLCPESFIRLNLPPGAERQWTATYVPFAHGPAGAQAGRAGGSR